MYQLTAIISSRMDMVMLVRLWLQQQLPRMRMRMLLALAPLYRRKPHSQNPPLQRKGKAGSNEGLARIRFSNLRSYLTFVLSPMTNLGPTTNDRKKAKFLVTLKSQFDVDIKNFKYYHIPYISHAIQKQRIG